MTETATRPPEHTQAPTKGKVEKAQSYLGLASTTIGIVGAIGTVFCWIATTFFEGQVEISPDKKVEAVMVKATDTKGRQQTFYTKVVFLMPGDYHLEFGVPDKKPTRHADVRVRSWQKTVIPYAVPEELAQQEEPASTKKWWQFWKHSGKQ